MNEQVEKLARECGAWNQVYGNRNFMIDEHFDIEKFAELIVRECAKVCDDLDIDDWGDKSFDDGTYYCSRAIKQHFGVEE